VDAAAQRAVVCWRFERSETDDRRVTSAREKKTLCGKLRMPGDQHLPSRLGAEAESATRRWTSSWFAGMEGIHLRTCVHDSERTAIVAANWPTGKPKPRRPAESH